MPSLLDKLVARAATILLVGATASGCLLDLPEPTADNGEAKCGTWQDWTTDTTGFEVGPVAALEIRSGSLSSCTAFLIRDGCALVTAAHCIPMATASYSASFGSDCSPITSADDGFTLLARDQELDYAVFKLSAANQQAVAAHGSYELATSSSSDDLEQDDEMWLAWAPAAGTLYVTHQESGTSSPRTYRNCYVTGTVGDRVRYMCDTTQVASGAPVLRRGNNTTVVALHSGAGGSTSLSACPNVGVSATSIMGDVPDGATDTLEEILDAQCPLSVDAIEIAVDAVPDAP